MSNRQVLSGFHAVTARLHYHAASIQQLYVDASRRDKRMESLKQAAATAGITPQTVSVKQLDELSKGLRHQGVVALANPIVLASDIDELLDQLETQGRTPFLLLLDGVTDPHNLGACLRTADAAGVHAVIAPKNRAAGLNATVRRVACGAAETVPYFMVTNLARTMRHLKQRGIWLIGTDGAATTSLYETHGTLPMAWVMGAEGAGLRRLTRDTCDSLIRIPMIGSVASLNVSVATAICLYETVRQRESA